jgi:hypothetical protein
VVLTSPDPSFPRWVGAPKVPLSILASTPKLPKRAFVMGIIPLWLSPDRKTQPRCAIVVGDRQFRIYVASDAKQRTELERLFGNRSNSADHRCPALLIPQPANARGPAAVAVRIEGTTVGHLHLTAAQEFLAALRIAGADRAACAAMIVTGRRSRRPEPFSGPP